MNFYQDGVHLYCVGGYGYSATFGDHTTYDLLTAIDVPGVIEAVVAGEEISSFFRQISDPIFQVTGGSLEKIYDVYHLLGGQKFIERYNTMGPDHGPGFEQEYTDAVRRFRLADDGTTIDLEELAAYESEADFHRRDYNAVAQILPNGQQGITMFSGVFQPENDLSFLNSVTLDSTSYAVNNDFQQYYNHYHFANVALYSGLNGAMHNLFFGGIAQYYDLDGTLVQDNNVPFVNTIARVSRDENGLMTEYKLPIEMPSLLGAGSEFIPVLSIPSFHNGVISLDEITADSTLIGYIYGGINSSAENIFWINTGTESTASSQVFKVYLTSSSPMNTHELNEQSIGTLKLMVYPNPNDGVFKVNYQLNELHNVQLTLTYEEGE